MLEPNHCRVELGGAGMGGGYTAALNVHWGVAGLATGEWGGNIAHTAHTSEQHSQRGVERAGGRRRRKMRGAAREEGVRGQLWRRGGGGGVWERWVNG